MALPAYSDLPTLQAFIGKVANTDTTLLTKALNSASRTVDNYTHRRFYLDGSVSQRLFDTAGRVLTPYGRYPYQQLSELGYGAFGQYGGTILNIDDIGDPTGMIVETGYGTQWTDVTANVTTLPLNAVADQQAVTNLQMLNGWLSGPYNQVRVTARWGWPDIPDEVELATLILAAKLYKRKDSPEGVLGMAAWGGTVRVSSQTDPDVCRMLERYVVIDGFA